MGIHQRYIRDFSAFGMLIGVRLRYNIRLVGDRVHSRLEKKELPVRTEDYYPAAKEVKEIRIKETIGKLFRKKSKKNEKPDNAENNIESGNANKKQ